MLNVRRSIAVLLLWLACLYNVERVHEPLNLASFVYVIVGIVPAILVCIPKLRRITLLELTLISFIPYAALKSWLGYPFDGAHLPITVTECVVLATTNILAWRVAHGIDEFVKVAGDVAAVHVRRQPLTHEQGETELYREVQRARRFQRPLSLASISFRQLDKGTDLEYLFENARREIIRRYVESRIADLLASHVSPADLIVLRDRELLLMCPEMDRRSVNKLLKRVAEETEHDLGLKLRVGVAEFPSEECTLAGLIDRAESEMDWIEIEGAHRESKDVIQDAPANATRQEKLVVD